MATFLKDVLYPGTYSVSDGKGGRRKVRFSREQVEALSQRMREMIEAGLSIPLAAEHQERAKPLTAEERKADWVKKLTMGWAEKAELEPEGFLSTIVNVPVDEEAKRLPAIRFVSPEIVEDFIDGTGRKWPGPSITHLAVTPRPVQHNQKPFQPVQMSVTRLSLADYEGEEMADEANGKGDGNKPDASGSKQFDLGALRALLQEDGYGVPDHITDHTDFLTHLHTAALSKKALIDKLVGDDDDDNDNVPEGGNPEPAPASGPIMMSLGGKQFSLQRVKPDGKNKGKGKKPASQPTRLSLDDADSPYAKRLLTKERDSIKARIDTLFSTGRITKPIKDKLLQDAGTVRLSLTDAGELETNAVLAKVEAYESLPASAAWPSDGSIPAGVQPADGNPSWGADNSPAGVAQTVDSFFSMLPGASK